ncbi:glycosyl transferase [Clostridium sp. NSJ-145]|nr:glycosyl transferase [Clostridium sp. NSJ-145]
MSIPKIIHYCWFGRGEKNELFYKCLESWKLYCPDYEIIEWNEDNYNIKNQYVKDAYKEKKWAFVTDYVRLDVVYNNGGIYLDTDVELVKPLDSLINLHAYFGVESQDLNVNTGLGFGAEKHSSIVKDLRDIYENISFYKGNGELNLTPCTYYSTNYFEKIGYKKNNETQMVQNVKIFSSEILSPYNYKNASMTNSENTISIHWYDASWNDEDNKKIHKVEVKIRNNFPNIIGDVFCFIYRKSYRVIKAIQRGELVNLFIKKLGNIKEKNAKCVK